MQLDKMEAKSGFTATSTQYGLSKTDIAALGEETLLAREDAYAPYSNFKVGAVLVAKDGTYIPGANVENASYGACICAEQTAIVKAVTGGHRYFKAIGVASSSGALTAPCGICRQVLREFAPDIEVYMFTGDGRYKMTELEGLLPMSFGPEDLNVETSK
ncbi:C.1 cytidine deaminase [Dipodascopsis uninucleata]